MALFKRNSKKDDAAETRFQLVTERGNGIFEWDGKLYHSDIIMSCIRPRATAVGKLTAKHLRHTGKEIETNPEPYIRFLLEEPNPYMTGQMLQEKLTNQLCLNNNAFAAIIRDENGLPVEIYPIPAVSVEAIYDAEKVLYLRFLTPNGKRTTIPYTDIIHIRQDYYKNDLFGQSPVAALSKLMEVVNTTDQGVIKAVKNSSVIQWLLKFNIPSHGDDLKAEANKFASSFMDTKNSNLGVAAVDTRADAKQVEPKNYVPNAQQMELTKQRLYSFFNTNEKIIQSNYNEDEWNAYYESQIEPIAIQLSNEFSRKLFSRQERLDGNEIFFEASNLQYASMTTKLAFQSMVDRAAMTPNEWREIMNLSPIDGGDAALRRLDTIKEGGEGA